jgi:hypothetical protein
MPDSKPRLAVLGGTGNLGFGLALRWARAGYRVVIGSRQREKAEDAVSRVKAQVPQGDVDGLANPEAAAAAEIVVMTVPFASHAATIESVKAHVQGKIFVDVTVPLVPPRVMRVQLPPEGSAGLAAQRLLGEDVRVVSAFQNVAADHLEDLAHAIDCDVLVAGNSLAARAAVVRLAEAAGMRAWHAGPIENAAVAEALTSALIFINRRYGIDGAGLRITGTPTLDPEAKE